MATEVVREIKSRWCGWKYGSDSYDELCFRVSKTDGNYVRVNCDLDGLATLFVKDTKVEERVRKLEQEG